MNTTITIERLDYKNLNERGGCMPLESLNNIELIQDVNEVYKIYYYFETQDEAQLFAAQFPKSYNAKISRILGLNRVTFGVYFHFNTFWSNATTGDKNESAALRRLKVIKKLKSI